MFGRQISGVTMSARQQHSEQDLNQQTARIRWQELETHFARGVVIEVDSELDLVEVATCFANDDKAAVEHWINDGRVQHLRMATARDWEARDPELWAVVVAPWVVVQECKR